jgi:hypothetical protein
VVLSEGDALAKISVELNPDRHERFVQAKMRRRAKSLQSLMIDATEKLLAESIPNSGDAPLTTPPPISPAREVHSATPAKDLAKTLWKIPEEVISLLLTHWHDADFRECLLALGHVWGVGDRDIKGSLTRNCRTFARASEMVEELRESAAKPNSPERKRRLDELLQVSISGKPKTRRVEHADGGDT